ncbi:flagellar assembly protein FliW [Oligoflexia bacterium]|nr:flagellar assembly protein FliW [Oligoflexia bacterium]
MSEDSKEQEATIVVKSTRFGDLTVPASSVIEFPSGLIGFPRYTKYIMLEHKPPFSWLQSVDTPDLAFVVVDGFEFGDNYVVQAPIGDKACDLKEEDEYAILVVVTMRPNPHDSTANLKAPLFVNLRNKKGVQVIFDSAAYSTRFPLWVQEEQEGGEPQANQLEDERPAASKAGAAPAKPEKAED